MTEQKIKQYIEKWQKQGYPGELPDSAPRVLEKNNLAPSWRAIAYCLLQNDLGLSQLGFSRPHSRWYDIIKKIEIEGRNNEL